MFNRLSKFITYYDNPLILPQELITGDEAKSVNFFDNNCQLEKEKTRQLELELKLEKIKLEQAKIELEKMRLKKELHKPRNTFTRNQRVVQNPTDTPFSAQIPSPTPFFPHIVPRRINLNLHAQRFPQNDNVTLTPPPNSGTIPFRHNFQTPPNHKPLGPTREASTTYTAVLNGQTPHIPIVLNEGSPN